MLWIGQSFSTPAFLKSRLIFGIVVGCAATVFFTWILFQMERHNATYKASVLESGGTQLELEEEEDEQEEKKSDDDHHQQYVQAGNSDDEDDMSLSSPRKKHADKHHQQSTIDKMDALYNKATAAHNTRRALSRAQQVQIVCHVAVLILFNYLLLVFLPGSALLSFIAVAAIWVLALHSYLRDELRRGRYDRLLTMMGLFLVIAGCLTLITYCRLALKDGSVYQGPARIVGYDATVYENNDAETLRADLEVSWGASWGCPDNGGKLCTAVVSGALCETEYDVADYMTTEEDDNLNGNDRRRKKQRRMKRLLAQDESSSSSAQGENFTQAEEEAMEDQEEKDEEVYVEEIDEEYEEDLEYDEEEVIDEADEAVEEYEEVLDEVSVVVEFVHLFQL